MRRQLQQDLIIPVLASGLRRPTGCAGLPLDAAGRDPEEKAKWLQASWRAGREFRTLDPQIRSSQTSIPAHRGDTQTALCRIETRGASSLRAPLSTIRSHGDWAQRPAQHS